MNDDLTHGSLQDRLEGKRPHRLERPGGEWILGIILVLLGVILYLQNIHIHTIDNWWALFILLPGLGSLAAAWRMIQSAGGRVTRPARSTLLTGVMLVLVTAVFLFDLNWMVLGPALLALAGVGMVVNAMLPE